MKLRRALCLLMAALLLCGAGVALADSLVSESFAGRWGRELVNENVAGIDAALSAAARAGSGARVYDLAAGDTLSLGAGASALLLSGSASMSAEGTVVNVSEGAGSEGGRMFGSVTNENIADALAEEGVVIDKKKIEIKESIRDFGDFEVLVRVYPEISAKLRITVVRA